ncbi:MAG: hypothetical protein SGJ13_16195 [Actinomycetota bacterium]|nr:hypothetical protein [Actinomycetota bacterium]
MSAPAAELETTRAPEQRKRRSINWAAVAEWSIYAGVALLIIWPVTFHLGTRLVGSGDSETYVWMNWRIGEQLREFNPLPMELTDAIHPYGSDLLTSDGYLPIYVGGLWNLVLQPVAAFNFAVLTATLLNLWAGRQLARRFSTLRSVQVVAAVAFATTPAIAVRYFGHYTFVWAFTTPLIIAAGIDIARGDRTIRPMRLGLLFFAAYLCSIFYFIFGALVFGVSVLCARWRDWRHVVPRVAIAFTITGVLMAPFVIARLGLDADERNAGGPKILAEESVPLSADVTSVVVQPVTSTYNLSIYDSLQAHFGPNVVEATVFPGFILLIGFGCLLLFRTRVRAGLLISIALLWILGLGPTLRAYGTVMVGNDDGTSVRWLPFSLLQSVPGLGMIRTPNRTSFTIAAVLAIGLAIGLDWFLRQLRTQWAKGAALATCAALLVANLVVPINWASMEIDDSIHQGLKEIHDRAEPGESIVFVPADCYDDFNNNAKLNTVADLPMVGCQANFASIPWYSGLELYAESEALAGLRCDAGVIGRRGVAYPGDTLIGRTGLQDLHDSLGARFYIVDMNAVNDTRCPQRFKDITEALDGNAEVVAENGRWRILDATPAFDES